MEEEIRQILFDLVRQTKIHKIDKNNSVMEVDYETAVKKLMQLLESSAYDQQ